MTRPLAEAPTGDRITELGAFETLQQITAAYWLSRCLHVVANLGVADALDESPRTPRALAAAVGANPQALGRVLRLLASHGVFEVRDGRFTHTPASRLLRADHPRSFRPYVRMIGLPIIWDSFRHLEQSVRTGRPAQEVEGEGLFDYFAKHPEEARIFDAAMTAKAHGQVAAVVGAYDFSAFRTIADIGGGRGHLLRAVLQRAPHAEGVLFDLPHVVAAAAAEGGDRLAFEGGDFFEDALPACDAYLLMDVLHDWTDEQVAEILCNVRRAAPRGARLVVIEEIVPDDSRPNWAKMLDVNMLVNTGGRQRDREEYDALFQAAGFRLERVIETPSTSSIVEATAQ